VSEKGQGFGRKEGTADTRTKWRLTTVDKDHCRVRLERSITGTGIDTRFTATVALARGAILRLHHRIDVRCVGLDHEDRQR
jgi:hypothetical protein